MDRRLVSAEFASDLPLQLLYVWASFNYLSYECTSRLFSNSHFNRATIDVVNTLIASWGYRYCRHLACRKCIGALKGTPGLTKEQRTLLSWLTRTLTYVANDGADDCTRIPNDAVRDQVYVPPKETVNQALRIRGFPPVTHREVEAECQSDQGEGYAAPGYEEEDYEAHRMPAVRSGKRPRPSWGGQ